MKFDLPLWNGIKKNRFNQKILQLQLRKSKRKGIFIQSNKKKINYSQNYTHMTALNWSGFLNKVRNNKLDFVKTNLNNLGDCLEIGAGDGFNMKSSKWKTYTICDPFLKSQKKNKIEIIGKDFENINFRNKFDTIIMFAVLEHAQNFETFLKKAKKVLKKGGCLFIEIPVVDDHFLNGDFNCLLHEHISYFFTSGIFNFIRKNKMFIKNFYYKNDSAYLCVTNKYIKKNFYFNKKILDLKFYQKLFKNKIKNFLIFLKKNENKKIVFYGANNGINSLLFFAKEKKISFKNIYITDGDSNKWNKYIGSFSKKISQPKIINQCDLICISALSFKDEIINKLDKKKPIINLNDI